MKHCTVVLPLLLSACATVGTSVTPRNVGIERVELMAPVFAAVEQAIATKGANRVLVVFDLDSTLLRNAMQEPDIAGIKDNNPDQFRGVERAVIYLSKLVPMEADLADRINAIQSRGVDVVILTARGADMRDMTIRELRANKFYPIKSPECGPPLCKTRGIIPPEDLFAAARLVVGTPELVAAGMTKGREITMADGVMTAAGLDKGIMLRTLLASYPKRYDTVLFVDDAQKNVDHVARSAAGATEMIRVFHYRGPRRPISDDPRVREQVNADWQSASEALCKSLKPRWCDADD